MIPHDETFNCGMTDCRGIVSFANGLWRCDTCDWEMKDELFNECDLFARHLEDQYPDLDYKTPIEEMQDEEGE